MIYLAMAFNFLDNKISIQFSDGITNIGNAYKRDETYMPHMGVKIPLEDAKAYRDFFNEVIRKHEAKHEQNDN